MFKRILLGLIIGSIPVIFMAKLVLGNELEEEFPISQKEVTLLSPFELSQNVNYLVSYGELEATQELPLSFQTSGVLETLSIQPGSFVEEGELLAQLENASLDAQVAQAEASYDGVYNSYLVIEQGADPYQVESAKSQLRSVLYQLDALEESGMASDLELALQKEMANQALYNLKMLENGASKEELATQWALVEQAQAGLDAAQAAYKMSLIYAPFSGEVVSLDVQESQLVTAGQSIGVLVNREDIEVVTYLSSEDIERISVGNTVWVNGLYAGEVIGISSRVDELIGQRKVRIQLAGLGDMTIGESVSLKIEENQSDEITLVPITAILFDEEKSFVYFYHDGAVYQQAVKTGVVLGDFVEVLDFPNLDIVEDISGLKNGESVTLAL